MKLLNKMERKFGRYCIDNLTNYVIGCFIIGYALTILAPQALYALAFSPRLILNGQVWRIFTWIVIPPNTSLFFVIFALLFYHWVGTTIENTLGAFRYNLFIFGGVFFNVVGSFIVYLFTGYSFGVDTYYLMLSSFLVFALLVPDVQVRLYFIIPIKVKWLAIIDLAILAVDFYSASIFGVVGAWAVRCQIIFSIMNFLVFYFATRNYTKISPKVIKRRRNFKKNVRASNGQLTRHKCAVCGRTELDDPNLEFRFCTKCKGNYEYCQDHLFTHTHVK